MCVLVRTTVRKRNVGQAKSVTLVAGKFLRGWLWFARKVSPFLTSSWFVLVRLGSSWFVLVHCSLVIVH